MPAQQPVHTVYSTESGLPSSGVYCVEQDNKGYIWASTDYGVVQYNGEAFTVYNNTNGFTDRGAFHIYKDKSGILWFITFNGKLCYHDGEKFVVPDFFEGKNFEPVSWMIENSNGDFCFATRDGQLIIRQPNGTLKKIRICHGYPIINMVEQRPGIYITYEKNIVRRINAATGEIDILKNFRNEELKAGFARLTRLKSGKIIISTHDGIYELYNNFTHKRIVAFDGKYGFNSEIFNIYEDDKNNIWLPTDRGLFKFDTTLNLKTAVRYFSEYHASTVIKDKENNIWIATTRGLIKIFSEGLYYYSRLDGLQNDHIQQVFDAGKYGFILINYEGNVYNLNKNKISLLVKDALPSLLFSQSVKDIGDNKMLIVTYVRTAVFDIKTHALDFISDDGGGYQSCLLKRNDTLFFTDHLGVGYTVSNKKYYYHKFKEMPFHINALERDPEGNLYFGTKTGLQKISANGVVQLKDPIYNVGVSEIRTTSTGVVWVATTENYIYAIYKNNTVVSHLNYTPSNTRIKSITLQNDSILWVATNNGAYKLAIRKDNSLELVYHYNSCNSLISDDINCIVTKGPLAYFATNKGLCVVDESLYTKKHSQPRVLIRQLNVGTINATPLLEQGVEASYSNRFFNIDFESAFYSWGKVNYKYRLEPVDTGWSFSTSRNIKYSSLPPGNYKFIIKAVSQYGLESAQARIFTFKINKPYWQTVWFWSLVGITAIFILYTGIRYRIGKLRHEASLQKGLIEAQLKTLRLQMNPHFIFNTLQSIQDYIVVNQNNLAITYLSKFSKLVRKALDYSKYDFITLKDEIDMLDLYVELEKARFNGNLDFIKQTDDIAQPDEIEIPPMLIQPFIENAIKHGLNPKQQGQIILTIKRQNDFLHIEIKDNGIGRKAAAINGQLRTLHKSSGIVQSTERLNMVFARYGLKGGYIQITDLYENDSPTGTLVTIKIPYANRYNKSGYYRRPGEQSYQP